MQIPWRDSDPEEAEALTHFLRVGLGDSMPPDDTLSVRCAVLRYYPQLAFVEITDHGHSPPRQLYAFIDPDKVNIRESVTVLDMTNAPVYALSKLGKLRLESADDAIGYVSFFFSCVAGPYGLMPVIETLTAQQADVDDETRAALDRLEEDCIPPRVISQPSPAAEEWLLRVALLFQGAVFRAEVAIATSDDKRGLVEVRKHEVALAAPEDDDSEAEDDDDGEHADEADLNEEDGP